MRLLAAGERKTATAYHAARSVTGCGSVGSTEVMKEAAVGASRRWWFTIHLYVSNCL